MKTLKYFPDEGFAKQIPFVTLGVALLVQWAAREKTRYIAGCVLQQLISGTVGSTKDWDLTRGRLNRIAANIKKEIKANSEVMFTRERPSPPLVAIPTTPRGALPADP